MSSILLYVLLLTFFNVGVRNEIIETKYGSLASEQLETIYGTKYQIFRKIPFAKPPLGELRFQLPQPPESWSGIRYSKENTPPCIQSLEIGREINSKIIGTEDCLYMNIYKPQIIKEPLPVIVFFHGGANTAGSINIFDPKYFMDFNIIFVNVQYRLNFLGFASLDDEVLPGNLGFKDQVAALRYVRENIASFGGNKESVTLMGHSAGAYDAHAHFFSPLSSGLFHRAILLSGGISNVNAFKSNENAKRITLFVANRVNCPTSSSSQKLIQCLRTVPAEHLLYELEKFHIANFVPIMLLSLVIERNATANTLINQPPYRIINNVPIITGFTNKEGCILLAALLSDNHAFQFWKNNLKRMVPIILGFDDWMKEDRAMEITDSLLTYYLKQDHGNVNRVEELLDLFSDSFIVNVLHLANIHRNTVYLYMIEHVSEFSMFSQLYNVSRDICRNGVGHADEMYLLFDLSTRFPEPKMRKYTNDSYVSRRMVEYFTNFASTGDPNTHQQVWKPVASNQLEYLKISTLQDQMEQGYRNEFYQLWKELDAIRFPNFIVASHKDEL